MKAKRIIATFVAVMLGLIACATPAFSSTPSITRLETLCRPVTVQAVEAKYGEQLEREGNQASGLAQTGDVLSSGHILAIVGDPTGDGTMNVTDLVKIAGYLTTKTKWDASKKAADLNADGTINISDLTMMAKRLREPNRTTIEELPPFEMDYFINQVPQMLSNINDYRISLGLKKLRPRADMNSFCQERAEEIVINNFFSHTRPDGRKFWEGAPYPQSGEILHRCWGIVEIEKWTDVAKLAVEAWKNSPGHDAIMRKENAKYIGGGISWEKMEDGTWGWVAVVHIGLVPP